MNKKRDRVQHINELDGKDRPITNARVAKIKVSSNWLTFLKTEGKGCRKTLRNRDLKKENNFKHCRISKATSQAVVTKILALDCEMVSDINDKNMLGRVSIVNYKLQCVYDKFVQPVIPVGDYRTRFSGIRESDLEKGLDFDTVQKEVKAILRNKILVGHALGNDFKVLKFGHKRKLIRDTAVYRKFREVAEGKSPSLKKLAKILLGENIQEGEHSSIEDAKTAMKLYIKFRHEWEASIISGKEKTKSSNVWSNVDDINVA